MIGTPYAIQCPAAELLDGVWYPVAWITWQVVPYQPSGDLPSVGWRWIPLYW